jgi:hypothetical protein
MKISFKNKNKTKVNAAEMVSILFLMLFLIIACEKTNDQPKYNPPADHTISKDGFLHKSGLNQPLTNCVSCHGSDLKGGTTGVSCYECHSKKW